MESVILLTKCGCERILEVNEATKMYKLVLPLMQPVTIMMPGPAHEEIRVPSFMQRVFKVDHQTQDGTYVYLEE